MDKWKHSYSCLLLETKNRFQQFASEFWSSTEEVHRKIQLIGIEVVRFFMAWLYTEYETSSAMDRATSNDGYKTSLNSYENAESESKMENFNTALARAECFFLLLFITLACGGVHGVLYHFPNLPLPSNHRHSVRGRRQA